MTELDSPETPCSLLRVRGRRRKSENQVGHDSRLSVVRNAKRR